MNKFILNIKLISIIFSILMTKLHSESLQFLQENEEPITDEETHCVKIGGDVKLMTAQYDTHAGWVDGITKKFCLYTNDKGNFGVFGLESLGSKRANFAGTYIKTIKIEEGKTIPGPYGLISMNLCHQLRGSMITFVTNGGYDRNGQVDMCFFGDGSSISGWTLYYLGVGGAFVNLKDDVLNEPLLIDLPDIYFNGGDEN